MHIQSICNEKKYACPSRKMFDSLTNVNFIQFKKSKYFDFTFMIKMTETVNPTTL